LAVLVIPFVGNLSDKIGSRPPIIVGSLVAGLLSFAYLWAIGSKNVLLAIVLTLLMWGIAFRGYYAVYTSFFPELFQRRIRVTGMAIFRSGRPARPCCRHCSHLSRRPAQLTSRSWSEGSRSASKSSLRSRP
jgi:MFS family permease